MIGRHAAAIDVLEAMFEKHPGVSFGQAASGAALAASGRDRDALELWKQRFARRGQADVVAAMDSGWVADGYRGACRRAADRLAARAEVEYVQAQRISELYALSGEADRAIDWLEAAVEQRGQNVSYMGVVWPYRSLHDHPRFQALAARLGLPLQEPA